MKFIDNNNVIMGEKPRYKIGNRIVYYNAVYEIVGYYTDYILHYKVRWIAGGSTENRRVVGIPVTAENDIRLWNETIHYDPSNFKPFDKVLMRMDKYCKWEADLFSSYDPNCDNPFHCIGIWCPMCIPYVGNEHLLGTSDDCDKYYASWEDNSETK